MGADGGAVDHQILVVAVGGQRVEHPLPYTGMAPPGHPLLSQDDTDFWRSMSVSRNAARINVPLLLNLADDAYLYALE